MRNVWVRLYLTIGPRTAVVRIVGVVSFKSSFLVLTVRGGSMRGFFFDFALFSVLSKNNLTMG